jgi:hypothetical protein
VTAVGGRRRDDAGPALRPVSPAPPPVDGRRGAHTPVHPEPEHRALGAVEQLSGQFAGARAARTPGSWTSAVQPSAGRARAVRQPAFWIVAALLVAGAVRMGGIAAAFVSAYPAAFLAAVGMFALYAVPFWLFLGELDYLEPEPLLLRATAFAWGGLVATSVSIAGSTAVQDIIAKVGSPALAAT